MKPAEGIKTLVLTLLFLSLLGLTGLIWLDDLQPGGEALQGPLDAAARALGLRPAAAEGLPAVPETSYTEAARPLRLVLTTERIHWRAWEGAAADGLYDRAREQLGEALGSAGMPARRSA
ncbi:MAG: hypothetical protein LBT60_04400, partial [Oscillospiraceae bacterium]|nr:hypothetical protein [Oscillospiraceae bacterium]